MSEAADRATRRPFPKETIRRIARLVQQNQAAAGIAIAPLAESCEAKGGVKGAESMCNMVTLTHQTVVLAGFDGCCQSVELTSNQSIKWCID